MLVSMPRTAQFLKNLNRFRLVTFDVTDTLLRFRKPPAEIYALVAEENGLTNINRKNLENSFRKQFKIMATKHPNFGQTSTGWQSWWIELVENVFRNVIPSSSANSEQLRLIAEILLAKYRTNECWDHIEGGVELIEKLRASEKYIGVISNFDPSLHMLLRAMGLDEKFDLILSSYDAGVQKPQKEIFEIPLRRFNVKAEESLHIGNIFEIDYLGARNSGWSSLLVTKDKICDRKDLDASHVFGSLTSMLDALETKDIKW